MDSLPSPTHSLNVNESPSHVAAYRGYIHHKRIVIVALFFILLGVCLWSIGIGSSGISIAEIIAALFHTGDTYNQIIVWNLRMPRVLTALVGGIALALAGCAYQSILRNPLASASTLGVSQGAAFGASVAIIIIGGGALSSTVADTAAYEGVQFAVNPYLTASCAFCGAIASTLVILTLSQLRFMTPESIVLAGVALSALFTGATTLIQYFADDSQVAAVVFWTFGDLSRVNYQQIAIMSAVTLISAIFFYHQRWNFNALESGERAAHGLGVNTHLIRLSGMFVASAAAACVIAFCGIINFIGLIAPHIMRRFIGSDYRFLLPASALCGAIILLISDITAHAIVSPLILPISAITSFVGAPVFLYLLFKGMNKTC